MAGTEAFLQLQNPLVLYMLHRLSNYRLLHFAVLKPDLTLHICDITPIRGCLHCPLHELMSLGVCRYNRLYTVTSQCKESQLPEYKATLQSALHTSAPPPLPEY